jgi:hypothetical protein
MKPTAPFLFRFPVHRLIGDADRGFRRQHSGQRSSAHAAEPGLVLAALLLIEPYRNSGMFSPERAARRFFERRTRVTMRASDQQTRRAPRPWGKMEESDMHQANAVASLNSPGSAPRRGHPSPRGSIPDSRVLPERHKAAIHGHFTSVLTRNSATRIHEDPFLLTADHNMLHAS